MMTKKEWDDRIGYENKKRYQYRPNNKMKYAIAAQEGIDRAREWERNNTGFSKRCAEKEQQLITIAEAQEQDAKVQQLEDDCKQTLEDLKKLVNAPMYSIEKESPIKNPCTESVFPSNHWINGPSPRAGVIKTSKPSTRRPEIAPYPEAYTTLPVYGYGNYGSATPPQEVKKKKATKSCTGPNISRYAIYFDTLGGHLKHRGCGSIVATHRSRSFKSRRNAKRQKNIGNLYCLSCGRRMGKKALEHIVYKQWSRIDVKHYSHLGRYHKVFILQPDNWSPESSSNWSALPARPSDQPTPRESLATTGANPRTDWVSEISHQTISEETEIDRAFDDLAEATTEADREIATDRLELALGAEEDRGGSAGVHRALDRALQNGKFKISFKDKSVSFKGASV